MIDTLQLVNSALGKVDTALPWLVMARLAWGRLVPAYPILAAYLVSRTAISLGSLGIATNTNSYFYFYFSSECWKLLLVALVGVSLARKASANLPGVRSFVTIILLASTALALVVSGVGYWLSMPPDSQYPLLELAFRLLRTLFLTGFATYTLIALFFQRYPLDHTRNSIVIAGALMLYMLLKVTAWMVVGEFGVDPHVGDVLSNLASVSSLVWMAVGLRQGGEAPAKWYLAKEFSESEQVLLQGELARMNSVLFAIFRGRNNSPAR